MTIIATPSLEPTPFSVTYPPLNPPVIPTFLIPLSFENNIFEKEIQLSIGTLSVILLFQLNSIDNQLYLSAYTKDRTIVYFGGFRCVFGAYINQFDNGFPYLIFFIDNSGNAYEKITFENLNSGVGMYAKSR